MKTPAGAGSAGGARNSLARRRVSYAPAALEQAVENLERAGFALATAPQLLERGLALAAWHAGRQDGYLIAFEEIGPIAHQGAGILDPYRQAGDRPRWQRHGTPDSLRMAKYAEAVLANAVTEMQAAPDGARNQTLNRLAFTVGRFLGWELSEADVLERLAAAAMSAGLGEQEARSTAQRALSRGAENPRDPRELEPRPAGQASSGLDSWRPRR